MNFAKFFALAKEKGILESQIQTSKSSSISIGLFHHEIENYEINSSQRIISCGVVNGKLGFGSTEKLGPKTFDELTDQILLTGSKIEKEEKADLFKGSKKYHKKNLFNPALAATPVSEKIDLLRRLENKLYAIDERVSEVEVSYSESDASSEFYNSHGLKLKQRGNYFVVFASVVAKQGEEIKTNYEFFLGSDLNEYKEDELVRKTVEGAIKKFGGESIESKKYPTVLANSIVASFINYFLSAAIADSIQRHSSFLEGKLGTKVASSKLTIEEKPLTKNVFFSYFDDEGVATYNKPIVKKGVLTQLFYNRETAKKDGVESTGNGAWSGSKIGTSFSNVFVKPGKQSFDELIAPIDDGVFITDIMGLGTGINPSSGDFSCQAEGYRIRNGKVAEPLTLITLSGNLLKLFRDLKGFDNDVRMTFSGTHVANAYIKSLNIGGK